MRKPWVMIACALAVCVVGTLAQQTGTKKGAQTVTTRGQTYASLDTMPDWNGAWVAYRYPNGSTTNPDAAKEAPPFKNPDDLAKYQAAQRGGDNTTGGRGGAAGGGGGRGGGAAGFAGTQTLAPNAFMEVLFTPGRVSLFVEGGSVRRIYTDGTVADPSFISAQGTSIGHWEGDILVVDTIGLNPKTVILGVAQAGDGFKVHERIFMKQKDVLEFDTTLEDPQLLTAPYHMLPQLFQHEIYKNEMRPTVPGM